MVNVTFVKQYKDGMEDGYNAVVKCPVCGNCTTVKITAEGLFRWNQGDLVQRAFPELSASEREVLVTGMCRKCQENVFGLEE